MPSVSSFACWWPLLLSGVLLAGCGQPADPYDVRVRAATINEYQIWEERVLRDLDGEVVREFRWAVTHLAEVTGGRVLLRTEDDMADRNNPLCRRINRKTIREVIVDGLKSANHFADRMISVDLDTMRRLVEQENLAEVDRGRQLAGIRERMEERKATIARNEERIKSLMAPR